MDNFVGNWTIYPGPVSGEILVPPSKSHSLRALLFALLDQGTSKISHLLDSPDIEAMKLAITQLGGQLSYEEEGTCRVQGGFHPTSDVIDAGNSGQILRFLGALSALLPGYTTITGDGSIRGRRPIKPLLGALRQLGAIAESARGDGFAPITVRGPMHPGRCTLNGEDSQPVSGLLIATSFLEGPTEIFVENPGETPWIDLTLDWIRRMGGTISHQDYTHYQVKGSLNYGGFLYRVPGDFSTAAYPIAAALITGSSLTLKGLDPTDVQGDRALINLLKEMGAKITWEEDLLRVEPSELTGMTIDVNSCIDALPILAVLGCYAKGTTTLCNGEIARQKESDRIFAMEKELKKMGAKIEQRPDGLVITQSPLSGASIFAHKDHRIALSLAVAALGAKGASQIEGAACAKKTYPSFLEDFTSIGANIELDLVRL